jgi:hypothetical protein
MSDLEASHSQKPSSLAIATAIAAGGAAAGFHFFFFEHPYGIGFVLFMTLLFAAVLTLALLTRKRGNGWAWLFAVPLFLSLIAEALYASNVVRSAGFLVSVISFAFFAYWISVPSVRFWDVPSLWPTPLFFETLFPFPALGSFFRQFTDGKRRAGGVLAGAAFAIPFVVIIGSLFISSDALVQKTVHTYFNLDRADEIVMRAAWDIFAAIFFAAGGWMVVTRLSESRRHAHAPSTFSVGRASANTFLIVINLLFAVFIGFQAVSFFGGESFIRSQGLSYADYARSGFFQLLWVAIIATGAITGVYRLAGTHSRVTRWASILLAVQTGIVMASAVRRMSLYIDAYGLSVLRFWALYAMYAIAAALALIVIATIGRFAFHRLVKMLALGTLAFASLGLLINVERIVAEYNVNAYLAGRTDRMDVDYLDRLSSDAIPVIVRLASQRPELRIRRPSYLNDTEQASTIADALRDDEAALRMKRDKSWRNLVVSDYLALIAIGSLK